MRKDVKLGLAVGAVLLAVIIVWAAVPHRAKKTTVVLNKQTTDTPAPPDHTDQPTGGPVVDVPPAPPEPTHIDSPTTKPDSSAASAGAGSSGAPDWAALLSANDVQLGKMMGQSHPAVATPTIDHHDLSVSDTDTDSQTTHTGSMTVDTVPPTTRPTASATPRTHTVQAGETLASIAKSIYGKSGMYLAIEKANPNVNANRLKIGTVLTLPSASAASSSSDSSSEVTTPTRHTRALAGSTVDSTKQYEVQPGDSLHKIAVKLYGNAARADELYTSNKEVIGDDPAKLKVGEILTLPEPPTASTFH
jgi:LysM repeat protein